ANQDELDSWMPDSKSFGVAGKMRQTSARRMRCPNKSASGNHLGQSDPHPPGVDDKRLRSKVTWQVGSDFNRIAILCIGRMRERDAQILKTQSII
ncbi:MAG: hypothetical protein WA603_09215, partial [Candidatus Acidiferrales bacterium]